MSKQTQELVAPTFEKQDIKNLWNTIAITKSVATTHFGLGLRTAFLKVVDEADLACVQVGMMGCGKTATVNALEFLSRKEFISADYKTLYSLAQFGIEDKVGKPDHFSRNRVTWISRDFSRVTPEVAINTLKLVCALTTEHGTQGSTMAYEIDIRDAYISWFAALVYDTYEVLWYSHHWRGNFSDRLIRLYVYSYERKMINRNPLAPTWSEPTMKNTDQVKIDWNSDYFQKMVNLLEYQFSSERAYDYADRLLRASALINDRDEVTISDYKFLDLLRLNLMLEKFAGFRLTLSAPLQIDIPALILFSQALKWKGVDKDWIVFKYTCAEPQWLGTAKTHTLVEFDEASGLVKVRPFIYDNGIAPQLSFEKSCLTNEWEW